MLPLVKPRIAVACSTVRILRLAGARAVLVIVAGDGRARVAAGIYAFAVSGLLGTSALYHA